MRVAAILKTAFAVAALGAVTACAPTPFQAQVARFQAMPAPQGQTFTIKAGDEDQRGGLEFAHYADLVAQHLTSLGYRPAAESATADMIITLSYGVDRGRERVVRDPFNYGYDPLWGPGWGYGGFYGRPAIINTPRGYRYVQGFYDPFLFGPGWGAGGDMSYTVYTSGIDLLIARTSDGEHLFEGSAEAASRDNDLTRLVPNLVEALFTGFPGNSGEKLRISIAPPEGGRR